MADLPHIEVQVAWALPDRQYVVRLRVPEGTTARAAALASGLDREASLANGERPDPGRAPLGIFGRVVADDRVLRAGDRVELYRPLPRDPRDARRDAAARGATIAGSTSGSPPARRS